MSNAYKIESEKPFNSNIFFKNRMFEIDSGPNIFLGFRDHIKRKGVLINTIDIKSNLAVHKYVYCDVPYPWQYRLWFKIIQTAKAKNVLFCFESPVVNPFNYIKCIHKLFNRVYTWNDRLVNNKKYFKFYLPRVNPRGGVKPKNFRSKKFLVLINSNKAVPLIFKLLSPFKSDLYIERVKAIEFFEKTIPDKFDLYGRGWNKARKFSIKDNLFGFKRFKSYKGEIKNKLGLLSNYKFCICYANTSADGYIGSGIFDCFKAGCVPIYWGAPNIEKYIPKDCFIDFRDFKNYGGLLDFLNSIDEEKYNGYIKNAKKFLASKETMETWFEKGFEKVFLESIST